MKKVFAIGLIVMVKIIIYAILILLASRTLKSAFEIPILTIKQCFALAFVVGVLKSLFAKEERSNT